MTAATTTHPAHLEYVLRLADTSLILGQRLEVVDAIRGC